MLWREYGNIRVGAPSRGYALQLTVPNSKSTLKDTIYGMPKHFGRRFTTYDRDQDTSPRDNCAKSSKSLNIGWWYHRCFSVRVTITCKLNTATVDFVDLYNFFRFY